MNHLFDCNNPTIYEKNKILLNDVSFDVIFLLNEW